MAGSKTAIWEATRKMGRKAIPRRKLSQRHTDPSPFQSYWLELDHIATVGYKGAEKGAHPGKGNRYGQEPHRSHASSVGPWEMPPSIAVLYVLGTSLISSCSLTALEGRKPAS